MYNTHYNTISTFVLLIGNEKWDKIVESIFHGINNRQDIKYYVKNYVIHTPLNGNHKYYSQDIVEYIPWNMLEDVLEWNLLHPHKYTLCELVLWAITEGRGHAGAFAINNELFKTIFAEEL